MNAILELMFGLGIVIVVVLGFFCLLLGSGLIAKHYPRLGNFVLLVILLCAALSAPPEQATPNAFHRAADQAAGTALFLVIFSGFVYGLILLVGAGYSALQRAEDSALQKSDREFIEP